MYKQASKVAISYPEVVRTIVAEDGVLGLMGRGKPSRAVFIAQKFILSDCISVLGLRTKILSNGVQGLMFSVLWKYIDDAVFKKDKK